MIELTRTCRKCNKTLPLDEFYKETKKKNGHQLHCKVCAKLDMKKNRDRKKLDPEWAQSENRRLRAHNRLTKREGPGYERKRQDRLRWMKVFPEKYAAMKSSSALPRVEGYNNHHWSYNEEHYKDIIRLPIAQHYLVHRFMVYDQERRMFRRMDGSLIDSREAAIAYYATLKDDTPSIITTEGDQTNAR
jgi:hypothetical protein